jgi:hypothetical protein
VEEPVIKQGDEVPSGPLSCQRHQDALRLEGSKEWGLEERLANVHSLKKNGPPVWEVHP